MRTRLKRFIVVDIRNKIDIRKYRKLFLAAVVLFCSFLAVFPPFISIEHLLFIRRYKKSDAETATAAKPQQFIPSVFSANGLYLSASASALTSIINYSDEPSAENNCLSDESSLIIIQKNALLTQANPVTTISRQSRDKIITYLVQERDTPISIAAAYGITANTLLWANNLSGNGIIRPGDELVIPPVSGVVHRVKNGETIDAIAQKYSAKSKDIIVFNELPADGAINEGQKLMVPDGQMPAPPKPKKTASRSYASIIGEGAGISRNFPWGQCTWYVAQKRIVTWSGHAKSWLANAAAQGYQTGNTAQAGAIVVLNEGGWMGRLYGHVAYVESVQNGWVTVSEMNYRCLGCHSVRTLNIHDRDIRGYIY